MKRNEDFRKALGEPDEYFRQSVIDTLDQLNMQAEKKSRPQRRYSTRIIASFAALVLAVTGIIFSRQYIPGISPDGHVDVINPTPTVAKQVIVSPVLDTVYATILFREAQKDGDNIRFTLEIQPKSEHFLIVSAYYLLTSACKSTADFYGIQPEDPEQSMYSWIVDHGYQQAIAFELNPPWDGIYENIYTQEKCQLRDDGSTVMTIVGPAADNNVYDLEWHMVPWNMEDRGDSFHPDLHSHGTIRLEVTDEKQCAVTVVTPYTLPVTGPQLSAMFSGEAVSDKKNNAAQQNAPTAIETDSAPAEPSPAVIPDIPPVEEYSALAWALSGEGYNDLLNGMDSRDCKVYVVKGTVQEVLSEDPLRVLINTSEDGTSQPVIVESPAYCSFTWEPGTYYRIYADVSSMENNIPILTARYSFTMSENIAIGTDFATLKVREAKTDGYGVFLQVEVQSKEENTLVVPNSLDIRNDSVMKLGIDENKSIYQWAVDNHYQLLIVDFNSPTDAIDSDTGLDRGFHPYWATPSFIEENGSTVIKAVGYAIPDTVQYELGFSLYSVDQDSSDILRYNLLETGVIPVTVSETEEPKVIAEYKATSSSCVDIPTPDATLTLLQSSCSDYCELRSGDTEHISSDSVYFSFMLSNDFFADGEFVEWGEPVSVFMLSHPAIEEDHTFVLRLFWIFPQEIPDKFRLSAWSDYYSGLYEKVR